MFDKTMVRGLLLLALVAFAAASQADVFNMGGTISGGTWTGNASLSFVTVGDPGNAADQWHRGCRHNRNGSPHAQRCDLEFRAIAGEPQFGCYLLHPVCERVV